MTAADALEVLSTWAKDMQQQAKAAYETAIAPSDIDFANGQLAAYQALVFLLEQKQRTGCTDAEELAALRATIRQQSELLATQRQSIELQERTIAGYETLMEQLGLSGGEQAVQ